MKAFLFWGLLFSVLVFLSTAFSVAYVKECNVTWVPELDIVTDHLGIDNEITRS